MHYISFRSKQRFRRVGLGVLIGVAILAALAIGVVIYLQRYVVYTPDGVQLDFSARPGAAEDQPGNPNFDVELPAPTVRVEREEDQEEETPAFSRISGYYVSVEMLSRPEAVLDALTQSAGPVSVLMDVRSIYGNYYYPSVVSGAETSSLVNASAVQQLIEALADRPNVYLIARLPALRDSAFAVNNQSCGLAMQGGALWMDADGCYWLDPADNQVLAHLERVIVELRTLGFDEVALDDFTFPESGNIVYDGDRAAAVEEAARRIAANVAESGIVLSVTEPDPALAPWFTRVYVSNRDGAEVQALAQTLGETFSPLENRLVFLTDSRDTRFAQYGLLRPALELGESEENGG